MSIANRTFFVADAEEVLKRLEDAQFSMVYLAPPWNTHLASESQTAAHEALIGTVIQQCHRLLTDDGALYFHAPSRSATNFRLILDQVFRKGPALTIVWKRGGPFGAPKFEWSNHDEILRYTKSDQAIYNNLRMQRESTLFNLTDERGPYQLVDLTVAGERSLQQFHFGAKSPPAGRSWRFSSPRMAELAAEGRIITLVSGTPRLKLYRDEQIEGELIGNVWDEISPTVAQGIHYPTAKPTEFVKRIVLQGSNPGCRILDPFAGSGQLLVQADLLGRHWTGVDCSEVALNTTRQLLKRTCGLEEGAINVIRADQIASMDPIPAQGQTIFLNVEELSKAASKLAQLSAILADLKKMMSSSASDPEDLLELIAQNCRGISLIISESAKADCLRRLGCEISGFTTLETNSQDFMATAMFVLDTLGDGFDFSVVSVSAWKAVETELATKLFQPFRKWFIAKNPEVERAVQADNFDGGKTQVLARSLKNDKDMPIGSMVWILDLLAARGKTYRASPALKQLSAFSQTYFTAPEFFLDHARETSLTKILSGEDIDRYRNGAAHTTLFAKTRAKESMDFVKSVLPQLICGLEKAPAIYG